MKSVKDKSTPNKKIAKPLTAAMFIDALSLLSSSKEVENVKRFFRDDTRSTQFMGVKMGEIFKVARAYTAMPLKEVKKLLTNKFYEVRMGAVSIMDFLARDKKTSPETKKDLYDLYIRHHRHINNWDLVDRSAPYVIGGYLSDKPRNILYKLAKSKNVWERRTAIVSTYYFIRQNDLKDTFKIAALLVHDKHDLINKAVGSWVREAGKRDITKLKAFLNTHADAMPKETLRYAIENLNKKEKDFYLKLTSQ